MGGQELGEKCRRCQGGVSKGRKGMFVFPAAPLSPHQPEAAPEFRFGSPVTYQVCEHGQVTQPLSELQCAHLSGREATYSSERRSK